MNFIDIFEIYFITFMSGPEMVSRIYAAKDEKTGVKATIMSGIFMGLFSFIPAIIGIVAFAAFPEIKANLALSTAVFKLSPVWISDIVCAAIIASTMSSADSNMLCASIIVGSAVGIYWQIMKEPYGILAIVAGTDAGTLAFIITTFIERAITKKEAPSVDI